MRSSFPNPWAEVIIEQMWIVRQSTSVVARCIDPELLLDPQAVVEYCLHPSAERLNALEFHGKRRRDAVSRHAHPRTTHTLAKCKQAGPAGNERRTT